MQIISQQGIKCLDAMVNLVWANTCISGVVVHYFGTHCCMQRVSASS